MWKLGFAVALMGALPVVAQSGLAGGSYAGQQTRDIKALSAEEQADLLAGRGMGLARAAELNNHPGPAHVLQLRDRLGLSAAQVAATQASFQRMEAAAKPLGTELVDRERALDEAFRSAKATTAAVTEATAAIGALQGRLRSVHLAAHLEMKAILKPEQVAAYDALRGYAGQGGAPPHRLHPG